MWTKHLRYSSALALALWLASPRPAVAISQCSFTSVVGVNFGAYDVFTNVQTDSTGSITFTCTGVGAMDTITMDLSKGSATSYFPRQMRQGAYTLDYNLYLDASKVSVWGDGTGGSSRYGPVKPPNSKAVTLTIYGRTPARQNVRVGSYNDTITATINF